MVCQGLCHSHAFYGNWGSVKGLYGLHLYIFLMAISAASAVVPLNYTVGFRLVHVEGYVGSHQAQF